MNKDKDTYFVHRMQLRSQFISKMGEGLSVRASVDVIWVHPELVTLLSTHFVFSLLSRR